MHARRGSGNPPSSFWEPTVHPPHSRSRSYVGRFRRRAKLVHRDVAETQAVRTARAAEMAEGVPLSVSAQRRRCRARDGGGTRVSVVLAVFEPMKSVESTRCRPPRIALKRAVHIPPGAYIRLSSLQRPETRARHATSMSFPGHGAQALSVRAVLPPRRRDATAPYCMRASASTARAQ